MFSKPTTNHQDSDTKFDLVNKLADAGELFQPVVISAHLGAGQRVKGGYFGKTSDDKNPTLKVVRKRTSSPIEQSCYRQRLWR